jgi:hypothetical protein
MSLPITIKFSFPITIILTEIKIWVGKKSCDILMLTDSICQMQWQFSFFNFLHRLWRLYILLCITLFSRKAQSRLQTIPLDKKRASSFSLTRLLNITPKLKVSFDRLYLPIEGVRSVRCLKWLHGTSDFVQSIAFSFNGPKTRGGSDYLAFHGKPR